MYNALVKSREPTFMFYFFESVKKGLRSQEKRLPITQF